MERTLARIQAVTGLVFGVFLALHLVNLFSAALGPARYDAVQGGVRAVVHAPGYELLLLLLPLLIHAVVGGIRMRRRARPRGRARLPLAARLHRISAWYLLLVVFGHMAATRIPAVFFDAEVGFAGVSFSLGGCRRSSIRTTPCSRSPGSTTGPTAPGRPCVCSA